MCSPGSPVVCLALSSPSGKALFEVPLPELVDFLGTTYAAVPTGGAGGGAPAEVVQWTFARQLLSDGVTVPAGEGDVQVWPSSAGGSSVVCLSLSSPSGRALFEVPLADLVEFLGRTYQAVPTGAESDHVDVDAELALLLWAEPET